jgi:hypothetical protein
MITFFRAVKRPKSFKDSICKEKFCMLSSLSPNLCLDVHDWLWTNSSLISLMQRFFRLPLRFRDGATSRSGSCNQT